MKIKIIKSNSFYVAGTIVDVPEGRGEYLVRIHIAEPVKDENEQVTSLSEPPWTPVEDIETGKNETVEKMEVTETPTEKVEVKTTTEKAENNTGNVPTAKPKSAKKEKKVNASILHN